MNKPNFASLNHASFSSSEAGAGSGGGSLVIGGGGACFVLQQQQPFDKTAASESERSNATNDLAFMGESLRKFFFDASFTIALALAMFWRIDLSPQMCWIR